MATMRQTLHVRSVR